MKFLKSYKYLNNYCQDELFLINIDNFYNYNYKKIIIENRKNIKNIRVGISEDPKKNSILRNDNNSLIQQFICLNFKKGKKHLIYKNINIMLENLFFSLNFYSKEFEIYKNYSNLFFLHNTGLNYFNFNSVIENITTGLESVFEIKTKKINKKLKLKEKYSHEIIYIPRKRRLKYVLRALSFYKESFKNYNIWERLFWSVFTILTNKDKSFLKKRREYIYIKSIKFFGKKKNPLK